MKGTLHPIGWDSKVVAGSEHRYSYTGKSFDGLLLRVPDGAACKSLSIQANVVGGENTIPFISLMSIGMLACISDFENGEAYDPASATSVVIYIDANHYALQEGEEVEVVLRNASAADIEIDLAVVYGTHGASRLRQYLLTADLSQTRQNVLSAWVFNQTDATSALVAVDDDDSQIYVRGGKIQEACALEFLEAWTRVCGETEEGTGIAACVYDSNSNLALPLPVSVEILPSAGKPGAGNSYRTLFITEHAESLPSQAKRARSEAVEVEKVIKSVPVEAKKSLAAKGMLRSI